MSYFVLTCVVLVIGYTIFLSHYLTRGFSLFVEFRLEEVAGNYLHAFARDTKTPLPIEGPIKGYGRYDDLPADIRAATTPNQLKKQLFTYVHNDNKHYEIYSFERADRKTVHLVFTATESNIDTESLRRFDFYYFYTQIGRASCRE